MNDTPSTAAPTAPALPAKLASIGTGGRLAGFIPQTIDEAWRLASIMHKAGTAPRGYDSAEKIMVAVMHGLEVGFSPFAAVQSITVINGNPTIWGDGAIGLAYASGEVEDIEEKFEGAPYADDFKAVCTIWRKGRKRPTVAEFSVLDAKEAGLWQDSAVRRGKVWREGKPVWVDDAPNDSPWFRYRKRMLKSRARAFCLRDALADVLRGIRIREEVDDYPDTSRVEEDQRAASAALAPPPSKAPPPPPPAEAPKQVAAPVQAPMPVQPAAPELIDAQIEEDGAGEAPEPAPVSRAAEFVAAAVSPPPPKKTPPPPIPAQIDDAAFTRGIEDQLKALGVGGDPEKLREDFETISLKAEDRMPQMFSPDAGALADLIEKFRQQLDL